MSGGQSGLLRRLDQTGVPLLAARLILGGMFIWMGLAKTGVVKMALAHAGLVDSRVVRGMVDRGLIDLSDPVKFLQLIREYQMVPESVSIVMNLLAAVLPWVEVLCGLLLVTGVAVRGTALTLLLMLIGFTIVIAIRAVGIHNTEAIPFCAIKFDCGCGAGEVYACHKIPENLGLTLLALLALVSRSRKFCLLHDLIPTRAQDRGAFPIADQS